MRLKHPILTGDLEETAAAEATVADDVLSDDQPRVFDDLAVVLRSSLMFTRSKWMLVSNDRSSEKRLRQRLSDRGAKVKVLLRHEGPSIKKLRRNRTRNEINEEGEKLQNLKRRRWCDEAINLECTTRT